VAYVADILLAIWLIMWIIDYDALWISFNYCDDM
jgi:hypothetical protein